MAVTSVNICVILLVWWTCCFCSVLSTDTHHVIVELDETTPTFSRHRRSTELPEEVHFRFPMPESSVVRLRLRREALVPVVTSSPVHDTVDDVIQGAGVYTDMDRGSSMIVKRNADNMFDLRGLFAHEGQMYEMLRDKRGVTHQVHPIRRSVYNLSHDDIEDSKEYIDKRHINKRSSVRIQAAGEFIHHMVEISFVADYSDFSWFVTEYNASTAVAEMRLWYSYIAHMINIRYDSISDPRFKINTVVVDLYIYTVDADDDYISNLASGNGTFNGSIALEQLANQVNSSFVGILPASDHYMYFTQLDIQDAVGIAYKGAVCTQLGVSVVENTRNPTLGIIAAHQLGRSLSAENDGDATTGSCPDSDRFVMSSDIGPPTPTNTDNQWKFSNCSVESFYNYLSGVTCTRPANTVSPDDLPARPVGEVYSPTRQCELALGPGYVYHLSLQKLVGGEAVICHFMMCYLPGPNPVNPMTLLMSGSTAKVTPHYAHEYTPCGSGKWCERGLCVVIPPPTTTSTTTTSTTTTSTTTTTTAQQQNDPPPQTAPPSTLEGFFQLVFNWLVSNYNGRK